MQRFVTLLLTVMLAGGCTMIPDYQRPATEPVPSTWPDGPAYEDAGESTTDRPARAIGWRDFFVDEQLKQLIGRALENNSNVRVAALEVERVRARYQLQSAQLYPEISVDGSYTREHQPSAFRGDGTGGGVSGGSGQNSGSGDGNGTTVDYYRAGVGITAYELDLFGRVRSLEQQALEQYLATIEARRSAQIALIAQVANAYLQLLADDALLNLAEKTLDAQTESLSLIRKRFDAGTASKLDVHQAQTAVETARADVARFRRRRAQDRNALVALVGGSLPQALAEKTSLDKPKTGDLPAPGLSSELLLRRPDVQSAEHQLKAANANIGAARAAFFPRISLTGSYGTISSELDGLFESGTTIWSFTPQISIPIFDGGRNEANLDVAKVSRRIEVAEYERTIRTAFREVADALAARGTLDEERAARRDLVAAARASYELSRQRYKGGVSSYLPVLDSQRALYDAQQALINAELANLSNRVTLYKVLGGGWRARTEAKRAEDVSSGSARRAADGGA